MIEDVGAVVITSGTLAMLFLEAIKWVLRMVMKNASYDFDPKFYPIMLAVLNALMPFVTVYGLGLQSSDPVLTLSVMGVVRYLLVVALGSIASVITYQQGVKPWKTYATVQKFQEQAQEYTVRVNDIVKGS